MCPHPTEELPEEPHHTVPGQVNEHLAEHSDPEVLGDEIPVPADTVGNGWLLLGIFLLLTVGVLMLLIFASGGNAESSMIL
ncbi:hypothetical protein L0U85_09735 [Glycomyces sp. L485]|uniref:hypothetical protein n=1 Tax=Glycomyces sp. L485 TaxID=2909235 RepID=UPI001F4BB005|nr:hypothetical protein [Glycomyces sp. L485]MCH7231132.1 hypothetical protein [Glycomyces sp. L485]